MKPFANIVLFALVSASVCAQVQQAPGALGYYRSPAIHGNTVVFTSEGDLWRVDASGGMAQRLTTHPKVEIDAHISPDGKWVGFTAAYEGPAEAYVMPIDGGVPVRCTYGNQATVVGWSPSGKLMYTSFAHSRVPVFRLYLYDIKTHDRTEEPLAQAHDGSFSEDGKQLFFTRLPFQGSQTKRYQGGTAQNIWRWDGGDTEARCLTADYKGTSRTPMWWNGRIYFESDRDGVMNIWSMDPDGHHLKQLTHHTNYDVKTSNMSDGKIVYQHGADIWLLDVASGAYHPISIRLASDFDQMREKWVKDPMAWASAAHLSPDGTHVVLTARGQVFVAPAKQGRMVEVTRKKSVRYRDARFLSDNKSLVSLSDESGEVELWKLPALGDGSGAPEKLTSDSTILRWTALPSPDGKWIAHTDKNHRLFLFNTASKANKLIVQSDMDDITDLAWSRDSKYLAFVQVASNTFNQIRIYNVANGAIFDATTDRFNSGSPSFTADGKFLYFLSDRHLEITGSPWGPRAPEPHFEKTDEVFFLALQPGLRSPFQPDDELYTSKKPEKQPEKPQPAPERPQPEKQPPQPEKKLEPTAATPAAPPADSKAGDAGLPAIDTTGLADRLQLAPIPPGNYGGLQVCGDRLFFLSRPADDGPSALVTTPIRNKNVKVDTVLPAVSGYETTPDGKTILAHAGNNLLVFDANGAPPDSSESRVNLDGWTFSFDPKEEWRQMFEDAWRLHRDYLYAPNMQGVDWPAMRAKYKPFVDRVTDRYELSDLLGQMVGEVSLLHTFVFGGDVRPGTDNVQVASLGAEWRRDPAAGGYRITKLYRADPDDPEAAGPLVKPGVDVAEGDVVAMVNGVPTLSVDDADELLRAQEGKQVRLKILPGGDKTKARDAIAVPKSMGAGAELRTSDWEYSRRQMVDKLSNGSVGYVHLRAMGGGDYAQWARDFYPVFNRQGLIVDVRDNQGGNIDSWILEKLLRRAWMYWNQRFGQPSWNMQYAFRGKIVVLCNEFTSSDGEAFSEGFKRLGLGKVIGTRTWGGEVWLTFGNVLVDKGLASAAELGVYGPEGKWLVEGHGVEPDITVDNLPHETYTGRDAQLDAGVKLLLEEIKKNPTPVPPVPPYPDKSLKQPRKGGK